MSKILIIAQIIPAIINIIKAVEDAIPDGGKGSEKLNAVKAILEASLDGFNELWPTLEKVIAVFVSLFNSLGIFKKK